MMTSGAAPCGSPPLPLARKMNIYCFQTLSLRRKYKDLLLLQIKEAGVRIMNVSDIDKSIMGI